MVLVRFLNKFRAVQLAIVAAPVALRLLSDKPSFVCPPIGVLGDYVFSIAITVAASAGLLTWLISDPDKLSATLKTAATVVVLSIVAYTFFVSQYVIRLERYNPSMSAIVSIGFQKTSYALQTFPDASPLRMLKEHGHREEDILDLWTESSVELVRTGILATYTLIFLSLSAVIGCLAQSDELRQFGQH